MSGIFGVLLAAAGYAGASGSGMSLTASPPNLASGRKGGSTFTTALTTVSIAGGVGPFTKAWTIVEADGIHGFSANSPTSLSTTFTITDIGGEDLCTATGRCTVTDTGSGGATAFVDVPIEHYRSLGIGIP